MSMWKCVLYICGWSPPPSDDSLDPRGGAWTNTRERRKARRPDLNHASSREPLPKTELRSHTWGDRAWTPDTFSVLTPFTITYAYIHITPRATAPGTPTLPTLLFIHSIPLSSVAFKDQIAYFASLGYGIIAPDLVGHGLTGKPLNPDAYKARRVCDEVVCVMRKARVRKAIPIAHGSGAYILHELLRSFQVWFEGGVVIADASADGIDTKLDKMGLTADAMGEDPTWARPKYEVEPMLRLMFAGGNGTGEELRQSSNAEGDEESASPGELPAWMSGAVAKSTRRALGEGSLAGTIHWCTLLQEARNEEVPEEASRRDGDNEHQQLLFISGRGGRSQEIRHDLMRLLKPHFAPDRIEHVQVNAEKWAVLEDAKAVNAAIERYLDRIKPPAKAEEKEAELN